MNPQVQFEKAFSVIAKRAFAFSFFKARIAFYAILRAMNIRAGDEIILPGYTCVMDVNPITYVKAKPVYVDIEPDTYNMRPDLVEAAITGKTKAIIVQHTYGYPCQMDAMIDIAARHNIALIEDCCLSLGSTYNNKMVGTFGQAAYFSFQWNKPFTTGLGGMATTDDATLSRGLERVRQEMLQPSLKEKLFLAAQLGVYRTIIYPRTTAFAQNLFRYLTQKGLVVGSSSVCEFEPVMPDDFFKAMSAIQARSGLRQLKKLRSNIAHRKKIAAFYDHLLQEKGWHCRQYDAVTMNPVMVRYPVRITEKKKALESAASQGIELGSWFESPLHPEETPLEQYGYKWGMCPEAEKAAQQVVNLPLHPRVSEKTAEKTVAFITQYTQAQ